MQISGHSKRALPVYYVIGNWNVRRDFLLFQGYLVSIFLFLGFPDRKQIAITFLLFLLLHYEGVTTSSNECRSLCHKYLPLIGLQLRLVNHLFFLFFPNMFLVPKTN